MRVSVWAAVSTASLSLVACDGGSEAPSPQPTVAPAQPAVFAPQMPAEAAAQAEAQTMPTTNGDSLLAEPTWVVLFAGRDLTSFNTIGGANWQLSAGVVGADGGEPGFLVTKGAYTDFRIRVEFQASSRSNSGIFIRCEDPDDVSAERCYEVNVFDENENANNRTGAIVNLAPPAVSVAAGDQWNTYDITAQGSRLVVRFNDVVTVDVEDDKHERGYIGLQYNGGPIRFRDVRLRPL